MFFSFKLRLKYLSLVFHRNCFLIILTWFVIHFPLIQYWVLPTNQIVYLFIRYVQWYNFNKLPPFRHTSRVIYVSFINSLIVSKYYFGKSFGLIFYCRCVFLTSVEIRVTTFLLRKGILTNDPFLQVIVVNVSKLVFSTKI